MDHLLPRLTRNCLLFLLCGCSAGPWRVDSIATSSKAFDGMRLCYANTEIATPLRFEMIRMGERMEGYLSLSQLKWSRGENLKVFITIGEETTEETLTPLEGRMRIRLSPQIVQLITHALQDGKKVDIMIDGFKETLKPEQFAAPFSRFIGSGSLMETFF